MSYFDLPVDRGNLRCVTGKDGEAGDIGVDRRCSRTESGRKTSHSKPDPIRRQAPSDDARTDQFLESLQSRPWIQVVKKIATMPKIRRGKVLNVRSQIVKEAYPVEERLAKAMDRVLEIMI